MSSLDASAPIGARATTPAQTSNVLVVLLRMEIGGTERHLARILPRLQQEGINVSLFLLKRGGKLDAMVQSSDVPVLGLYPKNRYGFHRLASVWYLIRYLLRHRPAIIHFFLPEPYLIGSIVAKLTGIKVRIMSRRSLAVYQAHHPVLALIERWLHRGTTALVGNSRAVAAELLEETGTPAKIGLIYNGIEIPPLVDIGTRLASRRELGIAAHCFVMVIVANLIQYKGHSDLLDALALARDLLPPGWRLLVVGRDDGMGAALVRKAQDLGLTDQIVWVGERLEVDRFLKAADVGLLCSHQEGFSNSLIEAMAYGLPVIATAVGGNLDAIVPGETGFLVPVKDPQALASALASLAGNAKLRAQLGTAGRRRAEDLFSIEGCVRRYRNMYQGVAEGRWGTLQSIIDAPAQEADLPAERPRWANRLAS